MYLAEIIFLEIFHRKHKFYKIIFVVIIGFIVPGLIISINGWYALVALFGTPQLFYFSILLNSLNPPIHFILYIYMSLYFFR